MSDHRSPAAREYRRWYSTPGWRKLRDAQLAGEPLCRFCREAGRIAPPLSAITSNPIEATPFQSLCDGCHSGDKQSEERTGNRRRKGSTVDGWPLDPHHHWSA